MFGSGTGGWGGGGWGGDVVSEEKRGPSIAKMRGPRAMWELHF